MNVRVFQNKEVRMKFDIRGKKYQEDEDFIMTSFMMRTLDQILGRSYEKR